MPCFAQSIVEVLTNRLRRIVCERVRPAIVSGENNCLTGGIDAGVDEVLRRVCLRGAACVFGAGIKGGGVGVTGAIIFDFSISAARCASRLRLSRSSSSADACPTRG